MSKLPALALTAIGVVALAGTAAVAADRNSHVMNVPLPDGSVAHVEYVGSVAPKVTIEPAVAQDIDDDWAPVPSVAGFDRMIAAMNRETQAMIRQAQQMARQPVGGAATPYVASFGSVPSGVTSTTIVSYSNGRSTCTRTTESVSQGAGKPPKVTTSVSGNCGATASPVHPVPSAAPISHT